MIPTADEDRKTQQAALLQAIVEQGSRGQAFYAQQQAAAQAQKQAAVQTALDRAQGQGGPGAAGAPKALQTQLTAQAAAPDDARQADIAQAKTYFDQDQQALTSANDTYMNQVGAAIPLVAKRAEAEAQAQIRQQALQRELANLELQRSQISLQQSQLGLEGQRESNAAARSRAAEDAKPKQISVAEQKYIDDQNAQARQNRALQGVSGSTQRALYDILSNNNDYPSAMSYLMEGIKTIGTGPDGQPDPGSSQFFQTFGNDVELQQLYDAIAEYYGVDPGQFAAGASSGGSSDRVNIGQRGPQ